MSVVKVFFTGPERFFETPFTLSPTARTASLVSVWIEREPAPAASTSCRDYSTVVTPSQSQEAASAMGA